MPESPSDGRGAAAPPAPSRLLFDLAGIDRAGCVADRPELERWIPHRGQMLLLDRVVWTSPDRTRGMGVRRTRPDEFWGAGHFPGRPIFPGVLMIEVGAQLACYLWVVRKGTPSLVAFLRIESAAFRSMVVPGDDFYVLCREVKYGPRRFISDIQGLVGDRVTFEARISGMAID